MFENLFGNKDSSDRKLTSVNDLIVGDIVVFKERLSLPTEIQGQQFEVIKSAGYYYSDGLVKELTLRNANNDSYFLSYDDNDGDPELLLSRKVSRKQVSQLFDENDFSQLFDENKFPCLKVQNSLAELKGWINDDYQQEEKLVEAYYYDRDCSENPPNNFDDDDGEELRYHECEAADDNYYLTVEIWEDGTTEVSVGLCCPEDVVEGLLPKNES